MRAGAWAAIGATAVLVAVAGCDGGGQPAGHLPTDTVTATDATHPMTASASLKLSPTPAATTPTGPDGSSASAANTGPPSRTSSSIAPRSGAAPTEHTEAGAIAAANAYIRAVDHAYATGDVGPMQEWTSPRCPCVRIATEIRQGKAQGYSWTGGRFTLLSPTTSAVTDDDGQSYTVPILTSITRLATAKPNGQPYTDPNNALGSEGPHPKIINLITLSWQSSHWTVTQVVTQDAT